MQLLEGSLLSCFPNVACYLITVETQACRLGVLSAAEARERVRVASKSAGSAAALGTASSAQLASDASLPHSPDGFSRGRAHLIAPIDSLTQEAEARGQESTAGCAFEGVRVLYAHTISAM